MPLFSPRTAAVLVLLLAALGLVPVGSAGAQDTATLTFGWPSDLKAHVTYQAKRTNVTNGQSEEIGITGSYDITTSAVAEGLLISFENIKTEIKGPNTGAQAMISGLLAGALSRPPSYVVAPNGRFLRADNLDQFRDKILSGLEDALSEVPDETRQQVVQMIGGVLSKAQIEAGIASDWGGLVEAWIEAELEQGELNVTSYNKAIPAFGNMEVPMRTAFQYKGRLACNDQDPGENCVELELSNFVDQEGLAPALEAFFAKLAKGQAPPRVDELRRETSVRLISDPNTLLPHLVEISKSAVTRMTAGGQTKSASRLEQKRFIYHY